jgi:hypothetical protein
MCETTTIFQNAIFTEKMKPSEKMGWKGESEARVGKKHEILC